MGQRHRRLDDDVHPFFEFEHLDGKVAGVAGNGVVPIDAAKCGVAPLRLESVAIERPLEQVGRVRSLAYENVLVDLRGLQTGVEWSCGDKILVRLIDALISIDAASSPGCAGEASVVHNALDVSGVAKLGARVLVVGAHPIVAGLLICFDKNVVTLTNVDVEYIGLIRNDWNEVSGDDHELVAIDIELEGRLNCSVDNTYQMGLAGLEGHLEADWESE
jgi:hypothetical protein